MEHWLIGYMISNYLQKQNSLGHPVDAKKQISENVFKLVIIAWLKLFVLMSSDEASSVFL